MNFNRSVGAMVKDTANDAGGLEFDSRSNLKSVAIRLLLLRRLFGVVLPARQAAEMSPPLVTRFGNTANVMKISFGIELVSTSEL